MKAKGYSVLEKVVLDLQYVEGAQPFFSDYSYEIEAKVAMATPHCLSLIPSLLQPLFPQIELSLPMIFLNG